MLPPVLFSTCVTVGEHSVCSRKGKGGYGIRPYDIVEIYLFLRREQAPALRYEIEFSDKNTERSGKGFFAESESVKLGIFLFQIIGVVGGIKVTAQRVGKQLTGLLLATVTPDVLAVPCVDGRKITRS